jgi:TPR repeat protein
MRHCMKYFFGTLAAVLLLAAGLLLAVMAGAAVAGELEDGVAAYKRNDYDTALRLLRPLAEQGYAKAQNNLGALYARGRGVPRDLVQAYMWFDLSAARGNPPAIDNRKAAADQMTPAQIAQAKALAHDWKPKESQ